MTDINLLPAKPPVKHAPRPAPPSQDADAQPCLTAFAELLFFAYRDFTGDADAMLAEIGFGRAHHRVLHFVNHRPGMRVAELLVILNITKQSLARVLRQLIDRGYIQQRAGEADRRERRLYLTAAGRDLAERLAAAQSARLANALAAVGPDGAQAVALFLSLMVSRGDDHLAKALRAAGLPDFVAGSRTQA